MKRNLKKVVAIVCVAGIFMTSGLTAFAATPENAEPAATSQSTIETVRILEKSLYANKAKII